MCNNEFERVDLSRGRCAVHHFENPSWSDILPFLEPTVVLKTDAVESSMKRLLAVDFLCGRVPVENVAGIVVYRAHQSVYDSIIQELP